jgi:hypothetical protein
VKSYTQRMPNPEPRGRQRTVHGLRTWVAYRAALPAMTIDETIAASNGMELSDAKLDPILDALASQEGGKGEIPIPGQEGITPVDLQAASVPARVASSEPLPGPMGRSWRFRSTQLWMLRPPSGGTTNRPLFGPVSPVAWSRRSNPGPRSSRHHATG